MLEFDKRQMEQLVAAILASGTSDPDGSSWNMLVERYRQILSQVRQHPHGADGDTP